MREGDVVSYELAGHGLTSELWDAFVQDHWGRRAVLFKNALAAPPIGGERLFEIFTVAAERHLATGERQAPGKKRARLSFYGDGFNAQVLEDHAPMLPRRSDRGFVDYSERLARDHGIESWGAFLNTIHPFAPDLWRTMRSFAADLFARIGLPAGRVGVESFIGSYATTPFGVHKDQAHIFTFPIVGEKITRLWPYEAIAEHLGLGRSERDLETVRNTPFRNRVPGGDAPIVLRAGPRDVTYWPPSYWHVVDGEGGVNGAVTLGIETHADPLDLVTRALARAPAARRMPPQSNATLQTAALRFARTEEAAAAWADALLSGAWKEPVLDELARQDSNSMFDAAIEPLDPVELWRDDTLDSDARFPIVTRQKQGGIACWINGNRFMLPTSTALASLLEHLNAGGSFSVRDLVTKTLAWREATCPADAALDESDVTQLLAKLVSFHALQLRRGTRP